MVKNMLKFIIGEIMVKVDYAKRNNYYVWEMPTKKLNAHLHSYFEVAIVSEGVETHKFGNKTYRLKKGSILIMPMGIEHAIIEKEDNSRHSDMYFEQSVMKKLCDFYSPDFYNEFSSSKNAVLVKVPQAVADYILGQISYMLSLLSTSMKRSADRIYMMLGAMIIGMAYDKFMTVKNDMPDWYVKILENTFKPTVISKDVDYLAEIVGFSHSHLLKLFKAHTGLTLNEYFSRAKISYAGKLLSSTDLSIVAVAEKVGYSSVSHFTKIFKHITGDTPAKYRKNTYF